MKKTALAAVFVSIVFINFTASLFAEDKALAAANRKTAVRFLKLAEDFHSLRIMQSSVSVCCRL